MRPLVFTIWLYVLDPDPPPLRPGVGGHGRAVAARGDLAVVADTLNELMLRIRPGRRIDQGPYQVWSVTLVRATAVAAVLVVDVAGHHPDSVAITAKIRAAIVSRIPAVSWLVARATLC
jgi:hypothetical protein